MAERQERIEAVHVEAQTQIIEEERYELAEAPLYHFEMSRRSFVKLMKTCPPPAPEKRRSAPSPRPSAMPFTTLPGFACGRCRWFPKV